MFLCLLALQHAAVSFAQDRVSTHTPPTSTYLPTAQGGSPRTLPPPPPALRFTCSPVHLHWGLVPTAQSPTGAQ